MTTLDARPHTALLVIDVQNGVVDGACRRDDVVANINGLVLRARAANIPVVWVQHSDEELAEGSHSWMIVPELTPLASEPKVGKRYNDSFEETALEHELSLRGVGSLVVTGAQTEWCVRSTLHGAVTRGYDTFLVSDAHTTTDSHDVAAGFDAAHVIAHTNHYWTWHRAPGRRCGTLRASEVTFPLG